MLRNNKTLISAGAFFLANLAIATTAKADPSPQYRLAPGDTVEIAVGRLPEQRSRVQIQIDGTIVLPGVGSINIAGFTPAELQTNMETLLSTRIFRQRAPDGREVGVLVKPGDVVTAIVEYRPVYVSGDVLNPGQQAYRPSMTVRQATSVAGGYNMLRARVANGAENPVDLLRDHHSLSVEYAKDHFHILLINAELQGKDSFDQSAPREISLADSVLAPIAGAEIQSLKAAQADNQNEKVFLQHAIEQTDGQLATLTKQLEGESKGVEADEAELARAMRLFGDGNLPSPRVTESRRALLLSSTRQLQTRVESIQLQRQRADYQRQLERVESQRAINRLQELTESTARLADLRAKLLALSQKLQPTGGASAALVTGVEGFQADITIVRRLDRKWETIRATEDEEIQPGDVIEVSLRPLPRTVSN
jgi:polysaccharide export outer membrane protein